MYERIWPEECILYGVKGSFARFPGKDALCGSKSIFPRDGMDISAEDLCTIAKAVKSDDSLSLTDIAEGWLYWFSKRGERYLKDAAKLGYMEVSLDLPIEIAMTFDEPALQIIRRGLRELVKGCTVGFLEDEYRGERLCRVLVSWG
jgi:hypothetical protein